ncbi:UvrD-helicase domain-containing protein [Paucibacter sp. DJ2R-2]|uniref:UvrD-helicase domain-containing protein n=1 Tax=Paucibacter sp. DJ2R-2 TaxID=2893558 RepID=UPI0021E4DD40|nr:UvrD-helicase domain-containing protein [Paucibacter sp. DJ2R-2]MCV2421429.1 UvrD-helicase domain-containing protein [Paucibacter sp. DJ4R-1]MCV2438111.1 UvrD-helicase domain-containing protein [Paucibacter sp. DJ2R-2]
MNMPHDPRPEAPPEELNEDLFAEAEFAAEVVPEPLVQPQASGLLKNLNPEQYAAVTLGQEPALILAGAGSGKTRVLTTRIAWLMQTGQLTPGSVMAVTFTNKASKEMQTRLGAMLPVQVRGMWIGTFHGLCNRFLRAHWKLAGLPQGFQILDASDSVSAIKRVIKAMKLDEERFVPKQVSWFIAGAKEDAQRPGDIEPRDEQTKTLIEIYKAYEDQCQREGVIDFAELMLRSYELMRDNPAVRDHYQRRFSHILVDEFQDTNKLQYAWLKMFAPPGRGQGVMAVGDDDQSIYAFRGARVGNMADFEREYRVKKVIKLEQNYRSFSNILDSANELISRNSRRLGKTLRTDAGAGELVRVFEAASDFAEAQWLIEEAQALHRSGIDRKEIAVLYRSNAQSRVIESALFNAGIPYRVYGGLRFFERAEVKHALSYLRLLENPNDDTSFLRVVNFPTRGIGARAIELLQDAARMSGRSLYQSVGAVAGKAGSNLQAFTGLIDSTRNLTQGHTLREIIEQILEISGLNEFYRNDKDGAERLENLGELINAAEAFVTQEGFGKDAVALPVDELSPGAISEGFPAAVAPANFTPDAETGEIMSPLAAFLTHASLEAGDNQAQAGQDAVQLMTVHSSKGLEFDAVFITGLEEGLFPHENSMSDSDGLEEERRLMYVAITRARQRLYLAFSQTRMLHGQTRYNVKSRFFDELPEACLKWLTPRNQGFGSGFAKEYQSAWERGSGLKSMVGAGRVEKPAYDTTPVPKSMKQAAAQKVADEHGGLKVGKGVFHTKFGEGVLLTLEGSGADARAQVNFGRHGMKWLALSVAKLTPID